MNRHHNFLYLLAMLLGIYQPAFSQNVSIQLGAFTEPVSPSFFNYSGFSTVSYTLSAEQFHQYTWGNFDDIATAKQQIAQLRQQNPLYNLTNLKIVPIDKKSTTSLAIQTAKKVTTLDDNLQLFSRFITFNEDNFSIAKTEVRILEEVRDILHKNPELKLRIISTHQSQQSTGDQQITATNIIKNFLLANQIPAYRVKIIPPTKNAVAMSAQKINTVTPPVIMTLVDLKEEIVLDRFNADRFFVKDMQPIPMDNVLE